MPRDARANVGFVRSWVVKSWPFRRTEARHVTARSEIFSDSRDIFQVSIPFLYIFTTVDICFEFLFEYNLIPVDLTKIRKDFSELAVLRFVISQPRGSRSSAYYRDVWGFQVPSLTTIIPNGRMICGCLGNFGRDVFLDCFFISIRNNEKE